MKRLRLKWRSAEHLVGQFCGQSHYEKLVTTDVDGIGPAGELVFAYRRAAFTELEQRQAYTVLIDAVEISSSRGDAAGPIHGRLHNRDWVWWEQLAIIEGLLDGQAPKPVPARTVTRAHVWLRAEVEAVHPPYDGFFDWWHERVKRLPAHEQKAEARRVLDFISSRAYSNEVASGTAGYHARDDEAQKPFGHATRWTAKHPKKFERAFPLVRRVNELYKVTCKATCADQWEAQWEETKHIDPRFRIDGTVFSTLTVNWNYRTATHRDSGNLEVGFSCLVALGQGWQGGEFILPEYRVAIDLQPGDLLMLASHEVLHANAPLVEDVDCDRLTLIAYVPENMLKLGSWHYEQTRMRFYKQHGSWKGMWQSQAWRDYLRERGMIDEDGLV